jgi:hypothetical protein
MLLDTCRYIQGKRRFVRGQENTNSHFPHHSSYAHAIIIPNKQCAAITSNSWIPGNECGGVDTVVRRNEVAVIATDCLVELFATSGHVRLDW